MTDFDKTCSWLVGPCWITLCSGVVLVGFFFCYFLWYISSTKFGCTNLDIGI